MPAKTATKRKAAPKQARTALKDRTNIQSEQDDDVEDTELAKPQAKRTKTAATQKPKTGKRTLGVIPETQPDPDQLEDIEASIEIDEMEITHAPTPPATSKFIQRPRVPSAQPVSRASAQPLLPRASARSGSAQIYPTGRERSTSASGTERERRGGDPEMRRRLNDLTKKHEDLSLKYQNLQELAKNEAESNFEKLKRAADQRAKDSNELVASLRKEIADLRKAKSDNSEAAALQKQVATLTSANERLTSANEKLTKESAVLKEQSQTAQQEVKTLDAKLAAARQQLSASVAEAKAALSIRHIASNTPDTIRELKMKENLYADLTNLIIRNVKITDDEDIFDCIQTGRNGTSSAPLLCPPPLYSTQTLTRRANSTALHYHLSIQHDSVKTPGGKNDYDDYHFIYEPLLDADRDRQLMAVLPDFLRESDIDFDRHDACKFFARIFDATTKKFTFEEVDADAEEGEE
nr:hypothetical protein CFP56_20873 [Quercus suber]